MSLTKLRLHRGAEVAYLAAITVLLVLSTWFLTDSVWIPAWDNTGIIFDIFHSASDLVGGRTSVVLYSILGLWLGFTSVWLLDSYKRRLFFLPLLFIGTVIVTVGSYEFLSDLGIESLAFFVATFLLGVRAMGIPILQKLTPPVRQPYLTEPAPRAISRSPYLLFGIILVTVLIGLADVHLLTGDSVQLEREGELFRNLLMSGILVASFYQVVRYSNNTRVILLGPARAGKTAVLAGLHHDTRSPDGTDFQQYDRFENSFEKNPPQLPDRTSIDDTTYIQMSYISQDWFFPRRYTISAFEYPGEILFDKRSDEDKAPIHKALTDARERNQNQPFGDRLRHSLLELINYEDSWERVVEEYKDGLLGDEEDDPDGVIEAVARLTDTADHVMITVPMDDFLGRTIERDNTTSYFRCFRIERTEESRFEVTLPSRIDDLYSPELLEELEAGESYTIKRSDGQLRFEEFGEECTQLAFESFDDLPRIDENAAYITPERERTSPQTYTDQLKKFIEKLQESGAEHRRFTWMFTMSDLIRKDFKNAIPSDVDTSDNDVDDQTEELVSNLDETNIYGENVDISYYKILSQWIKREYIDTAWGDFDNNVLPETREETIHPVWYDIKDRNPNNELIIRTYEQKKGPSTNTYFGREPRDRFLLQSDKITDRIEAKRILNIESILGRQPDYDECYEVLHDNYE